MRIEQICEYFNDIGILQLENINRFLKIYTQLSQNKYKNKSDKLILALFSFITLVSKNEQQLYDICKNIVNCFSNNQILYRYKALNIFNNIFKSKLHSKYILFFCKLNAFIFNKKSKIKIIHINRNSNFNLKKKINENENGEEFINNTSIGKTNSKINRGKGKIINKKQLNNKINKNHKSYDISDNEKECTFSPRINNYYRPNYKFSKNVNINNNMKNIYNSEYNSSYNNSNENMNDNSFNKFIPFKNSINYGYNNKINNEIEKMLINMSKYSNNPNNSKYLPRKTVYRKQINNIYPSNSYKEIPIYHYNNEDENNEYNIDNNDDIYHYYDEDYDFYKNENDHVKKVQDKILELKLKKLDKMSKECTFTPEINKTPKYLNKNMNNYLTDYNISHRNYLKKNNNVLNNTIDRKISKKIRINDEYADDYYNIYPRKLSKKKRARTYS